MTEQFVLPGSNMHQLRHLVCWVNCTCGTRVMTEHFVLPGSKYALAAVLGVLGQFAPAAHE